MMKINYDIPKSLKLCPPSYEEGVHFNKRIVTNIDNIESSKRTQVREKLLVLSNIKTIEAALMSNGYDYNENPIVVSKNPDYKPGSKKPLERCEFIVDDGNHRLVCYRNLGQLTVLVDVVDFSTERLVITARNSFNGGRAPFEDNRDADYLYSTEEAHKKGIVDGTSDEDVLAFLEESGVDSILRRKHILNLFRSKVSQHGSYMHPMTAVMAKNKAKELGLPYDGDSNAKNVPGLGLIVGSKSWRSVMFQSESIMMTYPDKPIDVYAFIENPNPQGLATQRKDWLEEFNRHLAVRYYDFFAAQLGITVREVKGMIKPAPWNFVGFLPQNLKTEANSVVNQFGIPVSPPDRKYEFHPVTSQEVSV